MRVFRYSVLTLCTMFGIALLYEPAPERVVVAVPESATESDVARAAADPVSLSADTPAAERPVTAAVASVEPRPVLPPAATAVVSAPLGQAELMPAPEQTSQTDEAVVAALAATEILATDTPAGAALDATSRVAVVDADRLNLRAGPGRDFDTLTTMTRGVQLFVTGEERDGWVRVAFQGFEGFVAAEFISITR
jgi:uncharacterized protein YgiM (DUF1202 family)